MISVVTPSFRQLAWLRLALASVADQRGIEVEHIVQDAGSGFEMQDLPASPNLRLFIEQDAGMYDAINRGLRHARGEICAYLNCDEQYLPGALARAAEIFAAEPELDVLFGDVVLTDTSGQPLSYRRVVLPELQHVRLVHLNTASCATFFRRRLLDRGFYFDPQWKAIGDQVWVESLLRAGFKMHTVEEPLATFAFTGENLGATPISDGEARRWRGPQRLAKVRTLEAILRHRSRKMMAGAYRRRNVTIDVYTFESPHSRQRRSARVGFGWPKN